MSPPARPAEEWRHVAFMGVALAIELAGGLLLGALVPVLPPLAGRLVEAHAWLQVQGFLGIFVAGMALRLVPRLAGRRPLPGRLTLPVLAALAGGALVRLTGQAFLAGPAGQAAGLVGGAAYGLGMLAFAGLVGRELAAPSRGGFGGWRPAAWAGAAWWLAGAPLTLLAGRGLAGELLPALLLGCILNFVWAVQARMVRVLRGAGPPAPGVLAGGLLVFNLGAALLLVPDLWRGGALLAGVGVIWLAVLTGAPAGRLRRLQAASRPLARFLVASSQWAVAGGLLLVAAGALDRAQLVDAGVHSIGIGMLTVLIAGMAQLIAPVFALQRGAGRRPGPEVWLTWPAFNAAAVLRLTADLVPSSETLMVPLAGAVAWLGLAAFALSLARGWRRRDELRQALARHASGRS